MQRFIHRENVKHLEGLLSQTSDDEQRQRLLQLLKEERAKLSEAEAANAHLATRASGDE